MAILGTLVKQGLALSQKLQLDDKSAEEKQHAQLRQLLQKARKTSFGIYYNFDRMLQSENFLHAFRDQVPIHDYDAMANRWWNQQQVNPDITWPGKPEYFALSSGTTSKSKRIPITDDFIQSIRDVGREMVIRLPNYEFSEALFESEILMLSSSAQLQDHQKGHQEGEISGINVSNFPGWYDLFYRPGKKIASIDDWDERVQRIVEEAPDWNIGALAGIPSWLLEVLKAIIKHHKLDTIHDIWPNLTAYASGGVAFETYRNDFNRLCKRPLTVLDTYLASEGFFAFTATPGSMSMRLALEHGYYYEFVPFDSLGVDERGNLLSHPMVCHIGEVELDQEYVLLISSCAGAWRYQIGDTIKFTDLDQPEIRITGRTKFFLNVVGSQLSEEKLDEAVLKLSEAEGISINEYSVGALKNENGDYIHQWVIVSDDEPQKDLAQPLDEILQSLNKNYAVARGKALKGISVKCIPKSTYHAYLASIKKKGGQVKTPKVMKEGRMEEYLEFIQNKG